MLAAFLFLSVEVFVFKNVFLALGLVLSSGVSFVWASEENMAQFLSHQHLVEAGRKSYMQNCMGCHGIDAKGRGETWEMLDPKPRNLVEGAFKFRSTSLGTLPTTEDLIRVIEQGIPRSSMPAFSLLSSQEKYALVAYIKSLRPDWKTKEGQPHFFPPVPENIFRNKTLFLASAFRGQKLYQEGCMTCHGVGGRGDGESAEGLVDNDGQLLIPADLTSVRLKSGRRAEDVYKAIYTGLDGTPMPAFEGIYEEAQIWDIVAYVFFLRGKAAALYDESLVLNAQMLEAAKNFNKSTTSTQAVSTSDDSWD
jgi:mono/diheme cytochrome c family protein